MKFANTNLATLLPTCCPATWVEPVVNAAVDAAHGLFFGSLPKAIEVMRDVAAVRQMPGRVGVHIVGAERARQGGGGGRARAGHVAPVRRIRRRGNEGQPGGIRIRCRVEIVGGVANGGDRTPQTIHELAVVLSFAPGFASATVARIVLSVSPSESVAEE